MDLNKIGLNLFNTSNPPSASQRAHRATEGWVTQVFPDKTEATFMMSNDDDSNIYIHLYDSNQFSDGIYYIQTNRSAMYLGNYLQNKVTLDTEGNDQNNYLYKWRITKKENDNYVIQTVAQSQYAWTASSSNLILQEKAETTSFEWSIQRIQDDYYSIQNIGNSNYLDAKSCQDNLGNSGKECTVDSTVMLFPASNRSAVGDQVFRLIPAPEKMDFLETDYHYLLATETNQDLKLTAWADFEATTSGLSREIRTKNPDGQSWLLKEVSVSDKKGYVIMNKKYNMALTKSAFSNVVSGRPLYPNLPETPLGSSEYPLYQIWDIQFAPGEYAEVAYTIRNLVCTSGCYLDLQDFRVKDTPVPFVLTRLNKYSPPTFEIGNYYYIADASTSQLYVADTFDHSRIYGWSITGENKQKWEIRSAGTGDLNAFYAMTLYKYPSPNETKNYYLTNESGSPKSVVGSVPKQPAQTWKIEADSAFYDLYYKMTNSNLYLTAPVSKTGNADFTLQGANSGRMRDQRFRFI